MSFESLGKASDDLMRSIVNDLSATNEKLEQQLRIDIRRLLSLPDAQELLRTLRRETNNRLLLEKIVREVEEEKTK